MEITKRKKKGKLDVGLHVESPKRYVIIAFGIISVCFIALNFILELPFFSRIEEYRTLLKRSSLIIGFIFLVLLIGKLVEKFIISKSQSIGHSYNLLRIARLLTNMFVFIVVFSSLFQSWYTAAATAGLISLILGFALQAPITSLIAWLYIIYRNPYRVGDRIQLNQFKGDVIEINYLDTTILEISGDYLGNDRLSGRIMHFPNSIILKSEVFNYSGPQAPFIWNETAIQIGYTSDLQFVEECLYNAAKQDFLEQHKFLNPELEQNYEPSVYFRVNTYAWLEAVVSYPVMPRETTPRRTRILKRALAELNKSPEKVLFPEGARR